MMVDPVMEKRIHLVLRDNRMHFVDWPASSDYLIPTTETQ